jgi:high-affinity iron transporter
MVKKGIVLVVFSLICFLLASPVFAAQRTWNDVVNDVDKELNKAVGIYKNGDSAGAKEQVNEAYFGPYEGGQMEKAVRLNVSAQANAQVEAKFREIKKAITNRADPGEVESKVNDLMKQLRQLANEMDGTSTSSFGVFLSSLLIIVREGFEAILILGAIIAYLVKSGNKEKIGVIYQGGLLAILASLVTAVAIKFLFNVSGASQEILEGVTMLIAVVVLFSVSFWLVSKVEAKRWQKYIEGKVKQSLGKGSTLALWFTVFLAVYREGAETVLFYMAMFSGAEDGHTSIIVTGLLVGILALVGIFIVVRFGSVRIPIKPFFIGTSSLMYYLAFVFAGQGINELQAGGVVSVTSLNIPTVSILGIYPTMESASLQALLVLAAIGGVLYQKFARNKTINITANL